MKAEVIEKSDVKDTSYVPVIKNEADDPNELSVSSISPLPEGADEVSSVSEKPEDATGKDDVSANQEGSDASKNTDSFVYDGVKTSTQDDVSAAKTDEPAAKDDANAQDPKGKDGVQKRIDEITKKRREEERARLKAERERDDERAARIKLEEEVRSLKKSAPAPDKPKPSDFETDADYIEALTDWKVSQALKTKEDELDAAKPATNTDREKSIDDAYSTLDEKMERGREKYTNFNELVFHEDLKISETMVQAIVIADAPDKNVHAEDVIYYLANHRDESERIAKLPPLKAAYEIGKIEAKLAAPKPNRIPKAPDPIIPVKNTGVTEKNPENMSPKEYREWREKNK